MVNLRHHPGKTGAYSDDQAEGAFLNGSRVRKINSELHDRTPDGVLGIILGSIDAAALLPEQALRLGVKYMYFVTWDDRPTFAVAVMDSKVAREQ